MESIEPLQKIFLSQNPIEELSEIRLLDKDRGGYSLRSGSFTQTCFSHV